MTFLLHSFRFLCLFLFLIVSQSIDLSGQDQWTEDVIVMKDGTVLKGQIISESTDSLIFHSEILQNFPIQRTEISTIYYNNSYTEREERYSGYYNSRPIELKKRKPKIYKEEGFFVTADFGVVTGEEPHWHSNLTVGKRIMPNFYIGIQGGKENTKLITPVLWQTEGAWVLGAYLRYYPFSFSPRAFVSGRVGYAFLSDDNFTTRSGGLNIAPGIGMHLKSRGPIHVFFAITQNIQKAAGQVNTFDFNGLPQSVNYDLWMSRSVFKVGIEF